LPIIIAILFLGLPFLVDAASFTVWNISARYFLGSSGSILSVIGFSLYGREGHREMQKPIKKYLIVTSVAFGFYGVVAGLCVPKVDFFPASVINNSSFFTIFGFPPQILRALAAILIAWSVWHIINIFNIESTRLYETQHHIADILQEALLVSPRKLPGIDFGYLYRSATEEARVGGDFYDLFELEHNKLGIILGDVSGKGLEAATLTSLVKNTIKAYAYLETSPASIMKKTNEIVVKSSAPGVFVTVFFAILNNKSGEFIYCNAGHPLPIVKKSSSETFFLTTNSTAIGVFEKEEFAESLGELNKEDVLILYSDGVTEARRNDKFYGDEKLIEFIRALEPTKAKKLPPIIFEEITNYTGGPLQDDVVFLAVSLK
jgi:serine phosphatase RsbU (regulator of sigma subunit)